MKSRHFLTSLAPFWLHVLFFKFGAGLHFTLLAPLGARILPLWLVGLLIGGAAFLQLLLDVPAGYILDRFGYVRLLRLSTIAFILAAALYLLGLTPVTFVLTLLLSTVGWLFFGPGTNAYMLARAPREAAGNSLGFYHSVSSGGIVLAMIVLPFVINFSAQAIGWIVGAILLCAWAGILLTQPEAASVHEAPKTVRHHYYIRRHFIHRLILAIRRFNPASTLLILQSFAGYLFYAVVWFVVPLVLVTFDDHILGIGLSVFDLAVVLFGSFLGKLADRWDQRKLVFAGLLLFAIAGTLIGFNLNIWFLVLGFLATAGDEMSGVSLWAWLDRLDKRHNEDGLVSGAIVLFEDLGWTIGPIFAGLLYVSAGAAWTITIAALPIFAVWVISLISMGFVPALHFLPAGATERPFRFRHKR